MRFTGQVVWITGASSGIGEALVHAFAREGARVVLSARRSAELERVLAALPGKRDHHVIVPLDLAASDTFDAAVKTVLATCGHVDLLINNGGIGQRGFAADTPLAIDRAIMEVNYFGAVGLTKALLPALRARRRGRIVVISSVVGYVATPRRSAYAASKHALHGFFNALRAELWREGIGVTLVCPGYVRTEISVQALDSTGGRHGRGDSAQAGAMSADTFAQRLLPALAAGRDEVVIGGRETFGIPLQRFLPGIMARILRRMTFS
jgi:dehydrogenase/reductase SDR family member 7B